MKIFLSLILIALIGCEPGSRIYIHNNGTSPLYIKTHPSVDSLYPNNSLYYETIISHKLGIVDKYSLFRVEPLDSFLIWSVIGDIYNSDIIPYDYIELINNSDTLVLDSREKIFNQMKKRDEKFDYFIEVVVHNRK